MKQQELFADVILPLPVKGSFTYRIPEEFAKGIMPGMRVAVRFGRGKAYAGVVLHLHHDNPKTFAARDILSVLDREPVVNVHQFKLWEWISEYYMCTLGEACNAALPSGMKLTSETKIIAALPQGNGEDEDLTGRTDDLYEKEVLRVLEQSNGLFIRQLQKICRNRNVMLLVKDMLEKGLVSTEERIREKSHPKMQRTVLLSSGYGDGQMLDELYTSLGRSAAKKALLRKYLELTSHAGIDDLAVERTVLLQEAGTGSLPLDQMIRMGIFESGVKPVLHSTPAINPVRQPVELNPQQQQAFDKLKNEFLKRDVALLHGVTSSGKTEIYIHFMMEVVNRGQQVLFLLPEIALTAQMINRLQLVFGSKVAVYHSKYSDGDRRKVWEQLLQEKQGRNGQISIVLGARSSVFLPFRSLGLVIVDEEHENTYKQYDPAPRYHARDTAIVLAGFYGAKVLLGTATPSLETYHNCMTGKYALAELQERYLDIRMPEISVVSIREARRRKSMHGHFSQALLDGIGNTMKEGGQVILFQNRRGFSSYIECDDCGWVPSCNRCDVSLTHHKHLGRLKCHYCGHSESLPHVCNVCGSEHLSMKGFGTERIEEEAAVFFPEARIGRLDLDAVRIRSSYEKLLKRFERQELDMLVGTQMVSKGLDFDHVKLVGIMSADSMLNYPDFRSYERSYQLMAQVSGRAGRKGERGTVIIQTMDELHPVIEAVVGNDYLALYWSQMEERKRFGYPPFTRLLEITLKHRSREVLDEAADSLTSVLKRMLGKRVIGPEYPLVSRIRNLHLKRTLIKLEKGNRMPATKQAVAGEIRNLLAKAAYRSVQVTVNVDPY